MTNWKKNCLNGLSPEQKNRLRVSRKLITSKAKQMHDEKCADESEKDSFVASRGWVENIMKSFGLSLRRKTTIVLTT